MSNGQITKLKKANKTATMGFSDCFVVKKGREYLKGYVLMPKHPSSH